MQTLAPFLWSDGCYDRLDMRKSGPAKRRTSEVGGSLEEFKVFLGPLADNYTSAELLRLRDEMHVMAEILLDFYLSRSGPAKVATSPSSAGLSTQDS